MFGLGVLTVTILIILVIALPIAMLSMHQNVIVAIISGFVLAFLLGRAASIIVFKDATMPFFGKNVFMGVFLIVLLVWGVSRLANRDSPGQGMGGGFRRRLNFDMKQLASTFAVAAVVVIAGFILVSNLDLNFGNLGKGFDNVWNESPGYKKTTAEIESFLRK